MYQNFVRDRITQLRLKNNISERELSLSLGKNPGYINNIVLGKTLPTMDSFFEICDYFDITPVEFFEEKLEEALMLNEIMTILKNLSGNDLYKIQTILNSMDANLFLYFYKFLTKYTHSESRYEKNKE